MRPRSREEERRLELLIRAAVAEERLLERRLDGIAETQRRRRAETERELRPERYEQESGGR